jgi:hypothetical protein
MLRANYVQFLQAEGRLVRMSQHNSRTISLRAEDALVHFEHVVCPKKYAWISGILVFSSIIADNLHAQSPRLNLAVIPIFVRFPDSRRRVGIQPPTFRSATFGLVSSCAVCAVLLRRGSQSTPSATE